MGMNGIPSSLDRLSGVLKRIRRECPGIPVQTLPWIHLKHPIHRVQEELLEEEAEGKRIGFFEIPGSRLFLPVRFLFCVLYAANLGLRALLLQSRLGPAVSSLKSQGFDLVAKTWCFDDSLVTAGADFYYGDLQKRLTDRGVRMLLLTGKATGMGWKNFLRAKACADRPQQIPEMCLVPPSAPLGLVFRQLADAARLLRIASRSSDNLLRRAAIRASRDCLSPSALSIGMYYGIGRTAVRTWKPKGLIALYEGYGWEQCLWRGAREEDPECRTVGYQHTILLRHNLALLDPEEGTAGRLRPDVVLCLGPRTESMLKSSHGGSELFSFGSFRRPASPVGRKHPRPGERAVLVLPEGYLGESVLLFNAALEAARRLPDHRFTLRSHPVLPVEQILPHLAVQPGTLPNVSISAARPIEADFSESSVVLYRGSSSVLYAVLHGLKPVYLQGGGPVELDPLFELRRWREHAAAGGGLEEVLLRYGRQGIPAALEEWRYAADYVESYTVPVDAQSVDRLLSSVRAGDLEEVSR